MNRAQHRLVVEWIGGIVILAALVAFGQAFERISWLRWVSVPFVLAVRLAYPNAETDGRSNINELAEAHPWLKWWAAFAAALFFVGSIVVARSQYRIDGNHIIVFLVLAIALVIGPVTVLNERRKFRDAGE